MTLTDPVAIVSQFFDRMAALDWEAMAGCLAHDVVRVGPYRDVKSGRDDYRDFLAATIDALDDYELVVQRIWSDGTRAVAQLSETMSIDGRRRRTDEAIVLDLGPDGLIARVEVYLQRSYLFDEEPEIVRG